jgi:hypothetical protein
MEYIKAQYLHKVCVPQVSNSLNAVTEQLTEELDTVPVQQSCQSNSGLNPFSRF